MASDDSGDKQFGRTVWDFIDSLLARPIVVAVIVALIVGAIVLALLGYLQVSHTKDGWDFCFFSCKKADDEKKKHQDFNSILKVPLGSTVVEARILKPDLILFADHIVYAQDFLGHYATITERYTDSRITDFSFDYSEVYDAADSQHDSSCTGAKYADFLASLSKYFGDARLLKQTDADEMSEEVYEFASKGGKLTFLAARGIKAESIEKIAQSLSTPPPPTCRLMGKYLPTTNNKGLAGR